MTNEPLQGPKEISAWLGVPVSTIYQWRHVGKGPKGYRVGKHLKFKRADVEQWLEAQVADKGQIS